MRAIAAVLIPAFSLLSTLRANATVPVAVDVPAQLRGHIRSLRTLQATLYIMVVERLRSSSCMKIRRLLTSNAGT
jgi:hypothetical protein